MGKIVVCADHPSNEFFRSFPNCYTYRTPAEFVEKVKLALASQPQPLVPELQHLLSWEAATDRFIDSAELQNLPPRGPRSGKGKRKRRLPIEAAKRTIMTLSLVTLPKKMLSSVLDTGLSYAHYFLSGIEITRRAAGALPGTKNIGEEFRKDLPLPKWMHLLRRSSRRYGLRDVGVYCERANTRPSCANSKLIANP